MNTSHKLLTDAPFLSKLLLFIGIELLCQCLTAIFSLFLSTFLSETNLLRTVLTLQNIILFILPALCVAYLFGGNTRYYLQAHQSPKMLPIICVIGCMIVSIPALNGIIEWNESLILPKSLSGIENWLKAKEASAQEITENLLQMSNVGELLLMVLIVGVLTGIGEEFVFRGILQRLFFDKFHNPHIAVWIAALLFSAAHLQFYGFVPRMLLGAFFGYLLIWSGNIWLPVIAHALNNSFSVIGAYIWGNDEESLLDTVGTSVTTIGWFIASTLLTIIILFFTRQILHKKRPSPTN
ncbi:MAG: CPBP family intramembrane metalloprotease [Porphyromonadaceae bacterium]|nr:CPBP family intramembrane metalloprotease [Porphyromonadaceae bacterium]